MKPLLRLPAFLAIAVSLLTGCSRPAPAAAPTQASAPAPASAPARAPAWTLNDLKGKPVSLSDYAGKVVILDFWATWCPPCRAEIPGFIALQKKYGAQGLAVIGASVDEGGPSVVSDFVTRNGINYQIVMATQETTQAYGGIEGIPTTFVIDRTGNIVTHFVGAVEMDQFEKAIAPLLAKK